MRLRKVKCHEASLDNFIQTLLLGNQEISPKTRTDLVSKIIRWFSSDGKCCWVSFSPPETFTPVPKVI